MRARKWPSGHLLGEAVKGLAYAAAAPIDVPEKLGLSELHHTGRELQVTHRRHQDIPDRTVATVQPDDPAV
jgi:hypothetical protein